MKHTSQAVGPCELSLCLGVQHKRRSHFQLWELDKHVKFIYLRTKWPSTSFPGESHYNISLSAKSRVRGGGGESNKQCVEFGGVKEHKLSPGSGATGLASPDSLLFFSQMLMTFPAQFFLQEEFYIPLQRLVVLFIFSSAFGTKHEIS